LFVADGWILMGAVIVSKALNNGCVSSSMNFRYILRLSDLAKIDNEPGLALSQWPGSFL
jgi:hypothetical protein